MVLERERIFVSTLSLQDSRDIKKIINEGLGIEIFAERPCWQEPESDYELTKQLLRHYEGPRSLHAPFYDLNLASENHPAIREFSIDTYKDFLQIAVELKCDHVTIHPNASSTQIFDVSRARQRIKQALSLLIGKAHRLGIKVAIENVGHGESQLFGQEAYLTLLEEQATAMALLDVGHAHLNGWDIPAIIERLGTRLAGLHLHDNDGHSDQHLPIGQGTIDWEPIWHSLAKIPQAPALILEYKNTLSVEEILSSVSVLKELTCFKK
ncbi:sugar phosphate isomerase/epimerase [Heliorestis acidaminivorans]|uniref:Sugar phosphate isomerase/epimerase n=1 Tax=Heliorestis acidaminivorans TaxID=553427 RepID=A0A6I0EU67_9FIRM|nr:sugar phosphate isomerase/epimerase family protein [Heliorestis acidaminivorans]KAB2952720.1 sugar phosphate isomerase/epimerase [Heliorestis acidaminivorans]